MGDYFDNALLQDKSCNVISLMISHSKIIKFTCRKNQIMPVVVVLRIKHVTCSCETFALLSL